MSTTTVTALSFLTNSSPSKVPTLVLTDSNGNMAVPITEFVQLSSGLLLPKPVDSSGYPMSNISAANMPTATTLQNAAAATGAGTTMTVNGGVAVLAVSGTFVATITVQGVGPDGNTYTLTDIRNRSAGGVQSTITAAGLYEVSCRGLTGVVANITTYTSGTVTVKGTWQALPPADNSLQLTGSNTQIASGSVSWNGSETSGTIAVPTNSFSGIKLAINNGAVLPVPAAPSLAASTTGGTIAASTAVYVKVTAVNSAGETIASSEANVTTGSGTSTNSITVTITAVSGATSYNVYASGTSGAEELSGNTTTTSYTLTAIPSGTASPPSSNTAGIPAVLTFQEEVASSDYRTWYDGSGTEVQFTVPANTKGVFGPFDAFPKFLAGQITVTAAYAPASGSTTAVIVQGV